MFVLVWSVLLANVLVTLRLVRLLRPHLPATESAAGEPATDPVAAVPFPATGAPAPPFAAASLDGAAVGVPGVADRDLVLLFVSPHCSGCRDLMPTIAATFSVAQRAGCDLVLVAFSDEPSVPAELPPLLTRHRVPAPLVLVPGDHSLRRDYNPRAATPAFCHLGRGLVLAAGPVGSAEWNRLQADWRLAAAADRVALRRLT